jgi:hypothetical protein
MRFKLSALLLLLTAAGFLLAAYLPLVRAAPDHLYEICIAFVGSIVAATLLVLLLASDEQVTHRTDTERRDMIERDAE